MPQNTEPHGRFVVETLTQDAATLREIAQAITWEDSPLTASVLRRIATNLDKASATLAGRPT